MTNKVAFWLLFEGTSETGCLKFASDLDDCKTTPALELIAPSKIRFLNIRVSDVAMTSLDRSPFYWALSVFTEMASHSEVSFQGITFQATFRSVEPYKQLVGLDLWEEMDQLFATNNAFANFRQLTFDMSILHPNADKVRSYTAQLMANYIGLQ